MKKAAQSRSRPGVGLTHATGNENVRQVLQALVNAGLLAQFATTLAWTSAEKARRLPLGIRSIAAKRVFEVVPTDAILRAPGREIVRNLLRAFPVRGVRRLSDSRRRFGVDWVAGKLDEKVARSLRGGLRPDVIFGYPNQSLATFREARSLGIPTVLEVPHAHWAATRRIAVSESESNPAWASIIRVPPATSKYNSAADEELALADLVFSPSRQVSESLTGLVAAERIWEAPYGCPPVATDWVPVEWDGSGRLRVIFVGRLDGLKGIADLATIESLLNHRIELTIVGAMPSLHSQPLSAFLSKVNYLGVLSRPQVLAEMGRNHVFILPSLVEGRSLAALEAVSIGLPIIVTEGSGVDDLALRGAGDVIRSNSPGEAVAAISRFLDSPALVREVSAQSLAVARESGWSAYRSKIVQGVEHLLLANQQERSDVTH